MKNNFTNNLNTNYIFKRVLLTFFMVFLVIFCISSCGNDTSSSEAGEMRTITDGVGRNVEIPVDCDVIACVDAFAGEVMIMSGGGNKMCCCPGGVKSDILLQEIYPDLVNTQVVQSGGDINAEALLALNPDVILFKNGLYEVPEQLEKIEKLGIPYLVIKYETMEEQISMIRMIGEVAGGSIQEKAEEIALYYEDTIKLVTNKKSMLDENDKVSVYHAVNSVNRTDGPSSLGTSWINAVGCKNVSVGEDLKIDGPFYIAGSEQVFVWNPDFVICNDYASAEFFRTSDMFKGLSAVEKGQVFNIPVGATRWGQEGSTETFFGMLWLGKTVYPKLYEDVDLKEEVFNFYENILGITLNDEIYDEIMEGKGLRNASHKGGK